MKSSIFGRRAALGSVLALIAGSVLIVGMPLAAHATATDNVTFAIEASVPGPVLSTPTVTVTITMTNKVPALGSLLMDLTPTASVPSGTALTCDNGVGALAVGDFFGLPDVAPVTVCTTVVTNSPGHHSLTFQLHNDDESQWGDSFATVEWDTPHVTVVKSLLSESGTVSGVAEPGELLTYRIRLVNDGTGDAVLAPSDIVETVPVGATAGGADSFDCAAGAIAGVACNSSDPVTVLGSGAPTDLTFKVVVDSPIAPGLDSIDNTVAFGGLNAPDCDAQGNDCTESTPTQLTPAASAALPNTGVDIGTAVGFGVLTLAAGGALLLVARRRDLAARGRSRVRSTTGSP